MLEASSFDFRVRHPQRVLIKLLKASGQTRAPVGQTAYAVCFDMYRTYAPLKQTTQTLAMACLELALRLHQEPDGSAATPTAPAPPATVLPVLAQPELDYSQWFTSRAEVMGTYTSAAQPHKHTPRPSSTV